MQYVHARFPREVRRSDERAHQSPPGVSSWRGWASHGTFHVLPVGKIKRFSASDDRTDRAQRIHGRHPMFRQKTQNQHKQLRTPTHLTHIHCTPRQTHRQSRQTCEHICTASAHDVGNIIAAIPMEARFDNSGKYFVVGDLIPNLTESELQSSSGISNDRKSRQHVVLDLLPNFKWARSSAYFGEPLVQMTTPQVALNCLTNCPPSMN